MHNVRTSVTLEDAITAYKDIFLAGRNLAPRTQKEYLTDLGQLCAYLTTVAGVSSVQAVTRTHLEGFLAFLDQQQLTGSTRRRKVAAIRSFFFFLEDAGHRVGNPAAKLIPPEREWNQPRYLTE